MNHPQFGFCSLSDNTLTPRVESAGCCFAVFASCCIMRMCSKLFAVSEPVCALSLLLCRVFSDCKARMADNCLISANFSGNQASRCAHVLATHVHSCAEGI